MKSFPIATGLPMNTEITSILCGPNGFTTSYTNEEGEVVTQFTPYPNDLLFDEVDDD